MSRFPMRLSPRWVFLIVVIFVISIGSAHAQNLSEINATTNKPSYEPGDKVIITGSVKSITDENPVTIIVRSPIGNVYEVGQVELMKNVFVHDFVLSDDVQPGTYTVNIRQGDQTTQIQFIVKAGELQIIPVSESQIKVRGENTSLVRYGNVQISTVEKSITIHVDTSKINGTSIMEEYQIPKQVIDAAGSQLIIKEDNNNVDCTQTETEVTRILDCQLQGGTKSLTIIGTTVIPEFGSLATTVFSITIMIIVILSRNKLFESFR